MVDGAGRTQRANAEPTQNAERVQCWARMPQGFEVECGALGTQALFAGEAACWRVLTLLGWREGSRIRFRADLPVI